MRAKKIKLQLKGWKRELVKKWLGVTRFMYNHALALMRQRLRPIKELRALLLNADSPLVQANPWLLDCPYDIRDEAVRDLVKNYKTNFARRRANPAHNFEIRFMSKKRDTQSMSILKKHWKNGFYCPTFMAKVASEAGAKKKPFRGWEPLPSELQYGGRLLRTKTGEFFLVVNQSEPASDAWAREHQAGAAQRRAIVSIDPGVRTFLTCYDPEGYVVEFGAKNMEQTSMFRNLAKLRRLASTQGVPSKKRKRLRLAALRVYERLQNRVRDAHYKCIAWLLRNYKTILLPKLDTARLVARDQSFLTGLTKQQMLSWNHSLFRTRLLDKARGFPDTQVIFCREDHTSKTCGACGYINPLLGSSKLFSCRVPWCNHLADRDHNAARNILLRFAHFNNVRWQEDVDEAGADEQSPGACPLWRR